MDLLDTYQMSNEYEEQSGPAKSAMNSAIAIMIRIDKLWKDAHEFAMKINYPMLNEVLDRIWLELVDDTNSEERKKFEEINQKLLNASIYGLNEKIQKKNPMLYARVIQLQRKLLKDKEIFIREAMKGQNKAGKYLDDIEDYMD